MLRCGSAGVVWYPYAGFSLHTDTIHATADGCHLAFRSSIIALVFTGNTLLTPVTSCLGILLSYCTFSDGLSLRRITIPHCECKVEF